MILRVHPQMYEQVVLHIKKYQTTETLESITPGSNSRDTIRRLLQLLETARLHGCGRDRIDAMADRYAVLHTCPLSAFFYTYF